MEHTIKSSFAKYTLWFLLLLILALDAFSLWAVFFQAASSASAFLKAMALFGVGIKIAIAYCLLTNKGPIKGLVNIWGGLFVLSGSTGLLSFVLSPATEPVQAYIDKGLFLCVGLLLLFISIKQISYVQTSEN